MREQENSPVLAERLLLIRKENKLSQTELGERLSIPQSTIGAYELGNRAPSMGNLMKYADFFHTTTDYLLGRTDRKDILPGGEPVVDLGRLEDYGAVLFSGEKLDESFLPEVQKLLDAVMKLSLKLKGNETAVQE